jgi:hypothetical protein
MRGSYLARNYRIHNRAASEKKERAHSRPRWLIGLYVLSIGVATAGWLAGLACAAIWLVQRAV